MSTRLLSGLAAMICLLASSPAHPQTRFRGKPLPECRSFWITEMGVTSGTATYVTYDVGHMVNVSPRLAFGGTLVGSLGFDAGNSYGIKARARRWLSPGLSVELSPGVVRYSNSSGYSASGLTAQLGINCGDWIGLTGQVEKVSGMPSGWSLGLKVGSYAGVTGYGLSAILGALAALAVAGAG